MADEKVVPSELGGGALDAVVRALFEVSWGKARGWIETGKVSVDGVVRVELRALVRAGARVALNMNAPRPGKGASSERSAGYGPAPMVGRDCIVHLDSQLVIVEKPAGVSSVPFEEGEKRALVDQVAKLIGQRTLEVVQRLDRETSGLIVFARNGEAARHLAQQFRFHTVHRRYLALAHGEVRAGTIRSTLVVNRGDGLRGSARGRLPKGEGQEAITHVSVVEKLQRATLIECRLETGRTHQIRIHLSEAGHPLLGERVYVREFTGEKLEAPRLMLHAAELGVKHPISGAELKFRSELPKDFQQVLTGLGGLS